jgi:hypothetical protein
MSFSLGAVFAAAFQKQKPDPATRDRGLLFLQTTDALGAQVALLQSLILPVVLKAYSICSSQNNETQKNDIEISFALEPR